MPDAGTLTIVITLVLVWMGVGVGIASYFSFSGWRSTLAAVGWPSVMLGTGVEALLNYARSRLFR